MEISCLVPAWYLLRNNALFHFWLRLSVSESSGNEDSSLGEGNSSNSSSSNSNSSSSTNSDSDTSSSSDSGSVLLLLATGSSGTRSKSFYWLLLVGFPDFTCRHKIPLNWVSPPVLNDWDWQVAVWDLTFHVGHTCHTGSSTTWKHFCISSPVTRLCSQCRRKCHHGSSLSEAHVPWCWLCISSFLVCGKSFVGSF